jgi:hypothetical protein
MKEVVIESSFGVEGVVGVVFLRPHIVRTVAMGDVAQGSTLARQTIQQRDPWNTGTRYSDSKAVVRASCDSKFEIGVPAVTGACKPKS